MNDQATQVKIDIWDEGIKNHCAKAKLSLLCYIDEIIPQAKSQEERERFGRVKARIHNELSQLSIDIRILFRCQKAGADITPLGDEMIRKNNDGGGYRPKYVKKTFNKVDDNKLSNPVLSK